MHITLKFFSPFLSIINKGVKVKQNQTNFSPPFCLKQRTKEGVNQINQQRLYAIYIHEEEDAKLISLHICITYYTLCELGLVIPLSCNVYV